MVPIFIILCIISKKQAQFLATYQGRQCLQLMHRQSGRAPIDQVVPLVLVLNPAGFQFAFNLTSIHSRDLRQPFFSLGFPSEVEILSAEV